ncbi:MAG: hypothetical protein ACHREM_11165 [Polyangiales bacterium]
MSNKPDRGDQQWALADAIHNLPNYVAGRLRGPGRPAVKTGAGIAGSRALHDEFLLGESIQRLRQYQAAFADCMFDYAAMTAEMMRIVEESASKQVSQDEGASLADAAQLGDGAHVVA